MENRKCHYCGKEKPESEMKQSKLTFRDRNPMTGKRFVNQKINWYCIDSPCATYDQYAHEG